MAVTTSAEAERFAQELSRTARTLTSLVDDLDRGSADVQRQQGRVLATFSGPLQAPLEERYLAALEERDAAARAGRELATLVAALGRSSAEHATVLWRLEQELAAAADAERQAEGRFKDVAWIDHTWGISSVESFVRDDVDRARDALGAAASAHAAAQRRLEEADRAWAREMNSAAARVNGVAARWRSLAERAFGDAARELAADLEHGMLWAALGPPAGTTGMGFAALASRARSGQPLTAAELRSLDPAVAMAFAHRYPELAGGLDGLPAAARHQANLSLLDQAIGDATGGELERLRSLRDLLHEHPAGWGGAGLYLLKLDATGDGRVVVSVGDPDAADDVVVYVPGVGTDLGGVRSNVARVARLHVDMRELGRRPTAALFYLDYDPPELDAGGIASIVVTDEAEQRAAGLHETLPAFLGGLRAGNPGSRLTVAAHSFGTFAVGYTSSRTQLPVDRVVLVGSPGAHVDHMSEMRLNPDAEVWAATTSNDAVGLVGERRLAGPLLSGTPLGGPVTLLVESGLVGDYGRDPTHRGSGALLFSTEGVSGHSDYFGSKGEIDLVLEANKSSLNIATIAVGKRP